MNYHVFIVNLKRCVEKKQNMEKKLKNTGVEATFLKGCDGKTLNKRLLEEIYLANCLKEWKDPHSGRNITWGEVGCALSHYKIYEYCLKNNIENAVVLEDDVDVPINLNEKLQETFSSLEKLKWDFCYIGRKPIESEKDMEINKNILRPGYSYWTCGYIINLKGMEKVINSNFRKNLIPIKNCI